MGRIRLPPHTDEVGCESKPHPWCVRQELGENALGCKSGTNVEVLLSTQFHCQKTTGKWAVVWGGGVRSSPLPESGFADLLVRFEFLTKKCRAIDPACSNPFFPLVKSILGDVLKLLNNVILAC